MADYPPKRATSYTAQFPMFSATTGSLMTGLTITSTISKDGGTHAATTNSASEVATASGSYKLVLTGTEMTADAIELHVTASGARDEAIYLETSTRQLIDLAFPNVSGRGVDVSAGGDVDAVVQSVVAGAIAAASLATDLDIYTAFVWMTKDGSTSNRYSIIWFKNGAPITSGITSPLLTVTNEANTVLVSAVTPTQVSTLGWYIWDEGTNRITTGVNYMAKVTATIDSATRTWETPLVTRDA